MLRNQPVFFTANVNVNVRSGPGTQFRVIAISMQGDEGDVVGTSPDGKWWAVPFPSEPWKNTRIPSRFTRGTNGQ